MKYLSAVFLFAVAASAQFTVPSFSAKPSAATTYTVTGAGSNGTTTCTSPVSSGLTTTCTLAPSAGYISYSASSDTCGGSLSGNTYTTGAVTSNCIVTAVYNQIFVSAGNHQALSATASTLTKTIAAGDVAACYTAEDANGIGTAVMTDSTLGSNTWTQSTSGYINYSTFNTGAFFYSKLASQVTSITATWAGGLSTNINLICYDLKNMATSSIEDSSVNHSATTTQTSTSGSLTTTNAKDILIFGSDIVNGGVSGWAATAPFTLPTGSFGGRDMVSYNIVVATQSGTTTTQTWSSAGAPYANVFIGLKTAP